MDNVLFEAFINEKEPIFDIAIISNNGEEYYREPHANNANNGHSTTKLFMTCCVGILRDRGLIDIDAPVTSFFTADELPQGMDEKWNTVTVRHAMQHKTGFEHNTNPCEVDTDEAPVLLGDFLKAVFSLKIEHEPGTFYHYSDEAYYLLSRIIAKAAGVPADVFLKENIADKLGFGQWATAKCPQGHMIGGGGFFTRALDSAKLGYTYACGGVYNGERIVSEEWVELSMKENFALNNFRNTDIFLKTGSRSQIIAFHRKSRTAVSWHGISLDNGKRNDRLLEAFAQYLNLPESEWKV